MNENSLIGYRVRAAVLSADVKTLRYGERDRVNKSAKLVDQINALGIMSRPALSGVMAYEPGKDPLPVKRVAKERLVRLAQFLDVNSDWLTDGAGDPPEWMMNARQQIQRAENLLQVVADIKTSMMEMDLPIDGGGPLSTEQVIECMTEPDMTCQMKMCKKYAHENGLLKGIESRLNEIPPEMPHDWPSDGVNPDEGIYTKEQDHADQRARLVNEIRSVKYWSGTEFDDAVRLVRENPSWLRSARAALDWKMETKKLRDNAPAIILNKKDASLVLEHLRQVGPDKWNKRVNDLVLQLESSIHHDREEPLYGKEPRGKIKNKRIQKKIA